METFVVSGRMGTLAFYHDDARGVSGGSWTPPPPVGRPVDAKTPTIIEEIAKLRAEGRPTWPLANVYWTKLSVKVARGRLRTFISKHRAQIDAAVIKYKKAHIPS
jgi:hypothetical protein